MSTNTVTTTPPTTTSTPAPTTYTPPTSTVTSEFVGTAITTSNTIATTTVIQTSSQSSSIASSSIISTNAPSASSASSSPTSSPVPVGPIVGGLVAALAVVLLFVFLLLKHRSAQKEIRRRAQTEQPTVNPFGFNFRERFGGYVSVNDGQKSLTTGPSSPSTTSPGATTVTPMAPNIVPNYDFSPNTFSIPPSKMGARTASAQHPPFQDEIIHLATMSSDPNSIQGPSSLSSGPSTYGTTRASHTSNPNQSPDQISFTHNFPDSNYAPPAYDTLPGNTYQPTPSRPKS